MRVITVSAAPFSGDTALAMALAESLGYRCVEPRAVVERAAAWGLPHHQLWAALSEPCRFRDRFLRKRSTHLHLLRAALVEEVRTGGAVCGGNLGELLPGGEAFLLRIRVQQPMDCRIHTVRERLKLDRAAALGLLHRLDREREAWLRYLYGLRRREALPYDLLIDLGRMSVAEACDLVTHVVKSESRHQCGRSRRASLEDFALSCRVRAALSLAASTAHLDLKVTAENGLVSIDGMTPRPEDASEIRRLASGVPGAAAVSVNGDKVQCPEGLPVALHRDQGGRRPPDRKPLRPAWVVASLTFCLTIVFSWFLSGLGSRSSGHLSSAAEDRRFTGVITDTICGNQPGMDAQCIRECVKSGRGAKYALFDGKGLFTLSDQVTPEEYAGQHVQIRGILDARARSLTVESIKLAQ